MKRFYKISIIAIISLVLFISNVCGESSSYTKTNGKTTATITKVESSKSKLYVTMNFKNQSSKPEEFMLCFTLNVWQNGRELSRDYFDSKDTGGSDRIKDGASINITYAYSFYDDQSIIEIDLDKWIAWDENPIVVYFNPKTQKWGTKKADLQASTPTPTITPTPTPAPTPTDTSSDPLTWTCPSCGKTLNSKFCPDCGLASPTPMPTPTPKPTTTYVPLDLSKPKENVVLYPYDIYTEEKTSGFYTGEIVDGYPHGYGLFDSKEWIFYGYWNYGIPDINNGNQIDKDNVPITLSKDSFFKYFELKTFEKINGSNIKIPYQVHFKEIQSDLKDLPDTIEYTMQISIYTDSTKTILLAQDKQKITLRKESGYSGKGNWTIQLSENTSQKIFIEITVLDFAEL